MNNNKWIFKYFIKIYKIFKDPFAIFKILICKIRSYSYSRMIDEGGGKIIVTEPFLSIRIIKGNNSKLIINGKLRIVPHINGTSPVRILLGANSTLKICDDFIIGQGVRISLNAGASLSFGGRKNESASGITADTLIMVYSKIDIGKDFVCAWNVFISDSDWHSIEGQKHYQNVTIGNHVWIANSCSILKGTLIGNNCIIASHSKLIHTKYPDNVLLGGVPAKILKENINWKRDLS